MKIDQKLLIFIPKISAFLDKGIEQTPVNIKNYLTQLFLDMKIGNVNDIQLSLIDKRDKTQKFYSAIITFKNWFESEYVSNFQKQMKARTAKIYLKDDEDFFYIYPQKKKINSNLISNAKEINRSTNNEITSEQNNIPITINDLTSFLVSQKNLLLAVQQDFMFYFQTIERNIENLRCQIDYNLSLIRQEQQSYFTGNYLPTTIYPNNAINNNYYTNTTYPSSIPQTDIYNRNYMINIDDSASWDDSKPIESIQRKKYNKSKPKSKDNYIDKLRSQNIL